MLEIHCMRCMRVYAGVHGCVRVHVGVHGCAQVCVDMLGCAHVRDEISEFPLDNRVNTSADYNMYPIRIFVD